MTKENPYVEMEEKVLTEHIEQLKEVMEKKNLSTLQFFGESLSEDTKAKVTEHASLVQEVKTLKDAATASEVSPDTQKLAEINVKNAISEIKAIDENFPIDGIVASITDPFQKIDVLGHLKSAASYSKKSVDAIKEQIGTDKKPQGYGSAPEGSEEASDAIVDKLIAASGVKLD